MTALGASRATDGRTMQASAASLQRVQEPVRERLDEVTAEMWRVVATDAPMVAQMSAHLMAMRGKMFRPTLVLLASSANDRPEADAIPLGAAVELIHLATLVHDDAIDHSVLRRGMPTLNSLFSHQISVIMGDFLYSTALTSLVGVGNLGALEALTRASTDMTIGELRQLAVVSPLEFSEDDYFTLIRSKTASLISAACEIGSLCGAKEHRETLARFGERLGMTFQITDDLIDYTEAASTTGKPTGIDLREHKVTLPLIAAMGSMSAPERKRVEALFAADVPDDNLIGEVIEIVKMNGGLEYARAAASRYAALAEKTLAGLPDTVARAALIESISYVMERHA
ncbi:MAG: polyprenyl synthetase family protein [Gemmatimonadaceae bacterium]